MDQSPEIEVYSEVASHFAPLHLMPANPVVSIVLPTYNSAEYIGASISSVLGQRFGDFELLVLDNASSDGTAEVVASFHDPRLRYRRNPVNLGFAGNVELGRSVARAPYVAMQNSDDQWEPDHLARTVGLLAAAPQLAFVHTRATTIAANGLPFGETVGRWEQVTPGRRAIVNCFVAGFSFPTMVIRNQMLRQVPPLPAAGPWAKFADSWLFLRLCLLGDVGFVPERLVRYRVHRGSIMFECYGDGSYFRRHLDAARDLFKWPEVLAVLSPRDQRRILRQVARDAVAALPAVREQASRSRLLLNYCEIAASVPGVLLHPEPWARLAFGLLPPSGIECLRQAKRKRWLSRHRHGTVSAAPGN